MALAAIVGSVVSALGISGGAEINIPGPLGIANWSAAIDVAKEELCSGAGSKTFGASMTVDPCQLITAFSDLVGAIEDAKEEPCPDSEIEPMDGPMTASPCKLISAFTNFLEDPEAALEHFPWYEMHCYNAL